MPELTRSSTTSCGNVTAKSCSYLRESASDAATSAADAFLSLFNVFSATAARETRRMFPTHWSRPSVARGTNPGPR